MSLLSSVWMMCGLLLRGRFQNWFQGSTSQLSTSESMLWNTTHKGLNIIKQLISYKLSYLIYMHIICMLYLVALPCPTGCNPTDCSPTGSSVHRDSPGKNTGVDSLSLLQVIFWTQEMNWGLPHCRLILYQLSYQGTPYYIYKYL